VVATLTASGLVAGTLHSSLVDGPGNRFVAFLQGCEFNCFNCHNPYTIPRGTPRANQAARPHTVGDVLAELEPLQAFLSGITVSGGEPTLQLDFLVALFTAIKEQPGLRRLTTFVDSNGILGREGWERLAGCMDAAMIDVKAVDPEVHRRITTRGNAPVLASVRQLHRLGKLHEVRLLVIEGLTDTDRELDRYAAFVRSVDPNLRLKLMAFRHHGVRAQGRAWPETSIATMHRVEHRLVGGGLTGVVPAPAL
jgi:pyruvate formate lyase activating enzyme